MIMYYTHSYIVYKNITVELYIGKTSTCYSSVIQDICSRFEDCIPSPIYATLAVLTIIGVVLSLIGIIATIVTLLLFK